MLIDTRVMARQSAGAGGLEVLAQRHEVMWRDGTAVVLHPVQANALPMPMLRAAALPCGQLLLVDLAKLSRQLDGELRAAPARDVPGVLFYSLRAMYGSAPAFLAAAQRCSPGTWWPVATGWVWQPAPREVSADVMAAAQAAVHASLDAQSSRASA